MHTPSLLLAPSLKPPHTLVHGRAVHVDLSGSAVAGRARMYLALTRLISVILALISAFSLVSGCFAFSWET